MLRSARSTCSNFIWFETKYLCLSIMHLNFFKDPIGNNNLVVQPPFKGFVLINPHLFSSPLYFWIFLNYLFILNLTIINLCAIDFESLNKIGMCIQISLSHTIDLHRNLIFIRKVLKLIFNSNSQFKFLILHHILAWFYTEQDITAEQKWKWLPLNLGKRFVDAKC